jgi:hypothetical protein
VGLSSDLIHEEAGCLGGRSHCFENPGLANTLGPIEKDDLRIQRGGFQEPAPKLLQGSIAAHQVRGEFVFETVGASQLREDRRGVPGAIGGVGLEAGTHQHSDIFGRCHRETLERRVSIAKDVPSGPVPAISREREVPGTEFQEDHSEGVQIRVAARRRWVGPELRRCVGRGARPRRRGIVEPSSMSEVDDAQPQL